MDPELTKLPIELLLYLIDRVYGVYRVLFRPYTLSLAFRVLVDSTESRPLMLRGGQIEYTRNTLLISPSPMLFRYLQQYMNSMFCPRNVNSMYSIGGGYPVEPAAAGL